MSTAFAFSPDRARPQPAARRPAWPGFSAQDILALAWRERFLMLTLFAVVAVVGVAAALQLKTLYPARSSLLIRLGSEYVYDPRVGDAARGAVPENDQVIQSEIEILSSPVLKARVIADVGMERLFPNLARGYDGAPPARRQLVEGAAIKALETGLKIVTAPGTSVVRLTYANSNPQMAALVLNTLIDEYLKYRSTVLIPQDSNVIGDQRSAFQARLNAANAAYEKFLSDNGVGDFDAEKASLSALYGQLLTDSYSVQAQISEAQGRLGVTAREVRQASPEIGLYRDVDHVAADKLIQLRLDRQDLLSRYRPDATPVRDADRKIAELEALSTAGQAAGAGARRVGVNPVYQTLETERNQLAAETASLRDRRAALAGEIAQVNQRRQRLAALEPQYQDLVRERDVLSTNVRNFTAREEESQAQQAISKTGDNTVRVVERAFVPTQGSSLKKPAALLALVFAAFAGVCAGLARAFLRRGFPTAGAAARTLDLPVLATATLKPAA